MRGVPTNERVYTLRTRPPSLLPPSPLSLASSGRQEPRCAHALPLAGAAGQPAFRATHHRQLRVLRVWRQRAELPAQTGVLLSKP